MKIQLFKKENDESVYYKFNTEEEKVLNFENIKSLATNVLNNKSQDHPNEIEVEISDTSLELYKTTLENVLKSIDEDEELLELFKNQNVQEEAEDTNESEESLEVEKNEND